MMENSNYLIKICVNEGENFPLPHEKLIVGENVACVVLEARFNEQVLRSDAIPIFDSHPKLHTELIWQMDRKSLHLFRIERKPIKLQCFIEWQRFQERQLVGYTVFDLRNTQDGDRTKFEWKTLLNPKYR